MLVNRPLNNHHLLCHDSDKIVDRQVNTLKFYSCCVESKAIACGGSFI